MKFVLFSKERTGFSQVVGQIQKCRQPGGRIHRAGSSWEAKSLNKFYWRSSVGSKGITVSRKRWQNCLCLGKGLDLLFWPGIIFIFPSWEMIGLLCSRWFGSPTLKYLSGLRAGGSRRKGHFYWGSFMCQTSY